MSFASRPSRRSLLAALGLGAGGAFLSACGGGSSGDGDGISVVTSAYPLAFLLERIGGDRIALTDLSTPGADAHGLELSVKQVLAIERADLVLQIPGFQAALDDAIASHAGENVLDVSSVVPLLPVDAALEHQEHAGDTAQEHAEGEDPADQRDGGEQEDDAAHEDHDGAAHDHGPNDPHFWHDQLLMADLGDAVASRLGDLSPEDAQTFSDASATLRSELEDLDAELAQSYGAVEGERPFITSHAAYVYLAERYDLHQIGIAGIDPETEPSPQRLLALEGVVQEEGVTTIFFESTASPKVAQTLARNLGIDSAELDNLETRQSEDADYPQIMRDNCTALVASWT